MVEISICIVTYQASQYLTDCLHSILESPPGRSFEIIVVDNGSTDGTAEMLRDRFPQVRLITNLENQGYTRPMNQALRAAAGRYRVQQPGRDGRVRRGLSARDFPSGGG